jgi:YD repeat-containing protein
LSSSTPAAPQTIIAAANDCSISFAFWFRASGLGKMMQGRGPNPGAQEKQQDRNTIVNRIQIYPGDLTLHFEDRIHLAAVAYDVDGNAVGGVNIRWRTQTIGGNFLARISRTGEFEARNRGIFRVIAEGAGQRAEATITVLDGPRRPRPTDPLISVQQISSRAQVQKVGLLQTPKRNGNPKLKTQGSEFAHPHSGLPPAKPMPQGGGSDGWNDGNYWSADDPGNHPGNPPGSPLDGGAGSGDFELVAPIGSFPGRGINVSLGAAYHGRVWNKAGSQMTFDIDRGWPAPGWSLGFGKFLFMGMNSGSMMVDADGTRHGYSGTLYNYGQYGTYFVGHTTDGTLIDYWVTADAAGNPQWGQATLPNGTIIWYGGRAPGQILPGSITDPNGNLTVITYLNNTAQIQTITDTLGRAIQFYYNGSGLLTAVTGPGLSGGTRTLVRLHYRQLTLSYGFAWPQIQSTVVRNPVPWVVDAIYYPATNTGFWFGDNDSYSSYGMIAKVIEQRGMAFSASSLNDMGTVTQGQMTRTQVYNYPLTPNYSLTDAPTYTSMIESWTRDGTNVDSATTSYSGNQNASPRTVIITLPNGTKSTQNSYNSPGQWNDGLIYYDETRDANNLLLQSSSSTWQQGAYDSPRPVRVEKTDERGQVTAAEFSYGSVYNQVTEVRDYDYGGTTLLRATRTQYQNSANYTNRHVFNLPLVVEVYAADYVTRVSRTEFQYDGTQVRTLHYSDLPSLRRNRSLVKQFIDQRLKTTRKSQ